MLGYRWKSKEKAKACLDLLGDVGEKLSSARNTLQSQPSEMRDYGVRLQLLRQIYSDCRLVLGLMLWQRHVDFYNSWQVFTFGHDMELRLSDGYLETIINQAISNAMPSSTVLLGEPSVKIMSPDPKSPLYRDLLKVEFGAQINSGQAQFEGTVTIFGFVSFASSHRGRFILYSMPKLVFSGAPLDLIHAEASNIEKRLHPQSVFDMSMLGKLGAVRMMGCQANEEYSLFGVRADHRPPGHVGGDVFTHSPIPYEYDYSIKIPSTVYVQSVYAENGGSIWSKGYVKNPHPDGTRYAYLFGVKYQVDIDANVDLGCFGAFRARYRRNIYIDCLLSFEVIVSNGVAKLQSVVRSRSDHTERSRVTVREMPNVSKAHVRMAKQGEIEFFIKEA